jgi:hypothetical protein
MISMFDPSLSKKRQRIVERNREVIAFAYTRRQQKRVLGWQIAMCQIIVDLSHDNFSALF